MSLPDGTALVPPVTTNYCGHARPQAGLIFVACGCSRVPKHCSFVRLPCQVLICLEYLPELSPIAVRHSAIVHPCPLVLQELLLSELAATQAELAAVRDDLTAATAQLEEAHTQVGWEGRCVMLVV